MNSRLYIATVTHARFVPVPHRFRYRACTCAFDLDELGELDRRVLGFGYNRPAPVSLSDRDYLRGPGCIRERLDRVLAAAGCADGVARVELLTMPRVFGIVFNPVSFHFAYRADGSVRAIVAEVNNTFGEKHLYVLDRPEGGSGQLPLRFRHEKQFHVSPFNDRRGGYEFSFSELGPELRIVIHLVRDGQRVLTAVLRGRAVPLDSAALLRHLVLHPLRGAATVPRIVWQAALLRFRRGLPVYRKPCPSHPMTIGVPPPGAGERVAMRAVRRLLGGWRCGRLTVELPDGAAWSFGPAGDGAQAVLRVRSYRFFTRVALGGDVGFGESFTEGEWTADDLAGLLALIIRNLDALGEGGRGGALLRLLNRVRHATRRNTPAGSRRNIAAHYDLSNDFYRLWLDPETMAYSCALFGGAGQALGAAQLAKIHRIIELADIRPGQHVLEIGCGWGGFAIEAARRTGCRVTGITVSDAQLKLARERVAAAGLSDLVDLRLEDYRAVSGAYDRIVSIEMLEAVGHEYFGAFFAACAGALRPGGRLVLQVITIPDARYEAYRRNPDWIQKHIFPGGLLPSRGALGAAMAAAAPALKLERAENIGPHYATTLRAWRERFIASSDQVQAMGFDEAFRRKWIYYLAYCEAGFATGYIDDWHLVIAR